MSNPYWAETAHDGVMNEFEVGFYATTDESSVIMHRFAKAYGTEYNITHNFWRSA